MISELSSPLFFEQLAKKLLRLPSWEEQKVREESWMTSIEIAQWCTTHGFGDHTEEEIEELLVIQWEKDALINIRPAKYPHVKYFRTLWGHVDRVYPIENKVSLLKTNPRSYYSQKKLPETAPLLFLSHSLQDAAFAVELSEVLNNKYGYRTWLCEESLNINDFINQEIRKSIPQCDAVILLLTFNALGSAYVHSEIEYAVEKLIPVIKVDDKDLMQVVELYLKDPFSLDTTVLLEKYRKIETKESRIKRYDTNAKNILQILQNKERIAIFPSLPDNFLNTRFIGLEKALEGLQRKRI
jgi:hypothetical protein